MIENPENSSTSFEVPPDMTVYYLRLLRRGPLWTPEETPEVERLQAAHIANNQRLVAEGKMVLVGPMLDNGDLRGAAVLRAFSLQEAREISETDPSVQAGRLAYELHPWMVYRGILPE